MTATKNTTKKKSKVAHDQPYPPAFVDFMLQGWKNEMPKMPKKIRGAQHYDLRRTTLGKEFEGEYLIVPTGHEKVRANDTHFRFRPGTDFFYLTGNAEADCVLVMEPAGRRHKHILFVEPNPGRSEPTFFTDRHKGELWVGPRLGIKESLHRFQVDACRNLADLPEYLRSIRLGKHAFRLVEGASSLVEGVLPKQHKKNLELMSAISEMRLIKSRFEIGLLKDACKMTRRGFDDVVRCLKDAKTEREVEAAFVARARIDGNDVGYNVIAAGGANACILHWGRNDSLLSQKDLLLLDAGIEGQHLYTADVTRTLPISGKYSPVQKVIYDLVRASQKAAIEAVKPGASFLAPHWAAMAVLAEGLEKLKLLPGTAEEAMHSENQFFKRFTLHGVSHMLGMDVHDCSWASPQRYRKGLLEPGMVLTIEPGLYFQKDDLTVPRKYRGIGVRIEDDVLVTKTGFEVLTDVPRDSDEVEAWMAELWAEC
ncbi:MAG: aminopeptidase P family protein [Myxococcota bacterium]|nr:aminopeptidase P family protein [Myxococcota bacterium]